MNGRQLGAVCVSAIATAGASAAWGDEASASADSFGLYDALPSSEGPQTEGSATPPRADAFQLLLSAPEPDGAERGASLARYVPRARATRCYRQCPSQPGCAQWSSPVPVDSMTMPLVVEFGIVIRTRWG